MTTELKSKFRDKIDSDRIEHVERFRPFTPAELERVPTHKLPNTVEGMRERSRRKGLKPDGAPIADGAMKYDAAGVYSTGTIDRRRNPRDGYDD